MAAKTWTEKLKQAKDLVVKPAPANFAGMKAGQVMLIPTPRLVDDFIRRIPEGTSLDLKSVRAKLAEENGAEVTCPITMGMQLRVVAEAAFEAMEQGAGFDELTPVWRVLDHKTPTMKKISFDPQFVWEMRAREGLDA